MIPLELPNMPMISKPLLKKGTEVAVVIGGGNIFRGLQAKDTGIERAQGDYMGMLATVINGMALQSACENAGLYTRLMSAIKMEEICETLYQKESHQAPGKGPDCNFWCRNGKSIFYN